MQRCFTCKDEISLCPAAELLLSLEFILFHALPSQERVILLSTSPTIPSMTSLKRGTCVFPSHIQTLFYALQKLLRLSSVCATVCAHLTHASIHTRHVYTFLSAPANSSLFDVRVKETFPYIHTRTYSRASAPFRTHAACAAVGFSRSNKHWFS